MIKYNFCALSVKALMNTVKIDLKNHNCNINNAIYKLSDTRNINHKCDIWINDIFNNIDYEELTEELIAWNKKFLCEIFNEKNIDSKNVS